MKDFDRWNDTKKHMDTMGTSNVIFHEREIWWCAIGLNVGDEQDGKNELYERPVLVIKKFNARLAWVLPMTTVIKTGKYYHTLHYDNRDFAVILSQMRIISSKRFLRFVRKISPGQHRQISHKLGQLLGAV
jgi:mRNA interferase MazF